MMGGPALAQLTPFEKEGCYNTVAIGFEHPKPGGSGKASQMRRRRSNWTAGSSWQHLAAAEWPIWILCHSSEHIAELQTLLNVFTVHTSDIGSLLNCAHS